MHEERLKPLMDLAEKLQVPILILLSKDGAVHLLHSCPNNSLLPIVGKMLGCFEEERVRGAMRDWFPECSKGDYDAKTHSTHANFRAVLDALREPYDYYEAEGYDMLFGMCVRQRCSLLPGGATADLRMKGCSVGATYIFNEFCVRVNKGENAFQVASELSQNERASARVRAAECVEPGASLH